MPKPRNKLQNTAIHALLNKQGISQELKGEIVHRITGGRTSHTSEMYFHEANSMIVELGGRPVNMSQRSQQLLRQKAGVTQLVTPEQSKLLSDLAITRWGMDYLAPLKSLSMRVIKKLRPTTTAEANKVIEAIKAMNKRDDAKEVA